MHRIALYRNVVFVTGLAMGMTPALHAQESQPTHQCTDPAVNNFVHALDTKIGEPGIGHVEKRGKGKTPLILIPGAAFDWTIWQSFMDRNAADYTTYAITPAGYGDTAPPPIPPAESLANPVWTDALINGIAALIKAEHLHRPIVIGHHMMGDYYAIRMAVEHGDLIGGVVILSGSPNFAIPAYGFNKPGSPVKLANAEQRLRSVHAFFVPFYHHVTQKMWRSGSFQARRFCRDKKRARELFEQQVAVPIPTQVRHFLEYLVADPTLGLSECRVPFLVIIPKEKWTLDRALDAFRESNEMMYGKDPAMAKAAWTQQFQAGWGDVELGVKWSYDQSFQWGQFKSMMSDLTIKRIGGTRIFIMEDQPKALDDAIRAFVTGPPRSSSPDGASAASTRKGT